MLADRLLYKNRWTNGGLGLCCSMPLSTIFQLYRGIGQMIQKRNSFIIDIKKYIHIWKRIN